MEEKKSPDLLPEEMKRKKNPKTKEIKGKVELFIPTKEKIKFFSGLFLFFKNIFSQRKKEIQEGKEKIPSAEPEVEQYVSPEISLMPTQIFITPTLWRQKKNRLLIVVIISLLIIFSSYLSLDYFLKKKLSETEDLTNELKNIEKQIAETKVFLKKIKNYELMVLEIESLLRKQPHWTNFFSLLEKHTLPEVYYRDFSGDLSGKITLPAVAKDLPSFIKQLSIFQNAKDFIKEVKFSGFTYFPEKKDEGISFSFELILNEQIFYSKE